MDLRLSVMNSSTHGLPPLKETSPFQGFTYFIKKSVVCACFIPIRPRLRCAWALTIMFRRAFPDRAFDLPFGFASIVLFAYGLVTGNFALLADLCLAADHLEQKPSATGSG